MAVPMLQPAPAGPAPAPARLPVLHAPPQAGLLDAWEAGDGQPLPWRALLLLALACPAVAQEALRAWPVGRRDLHLLALRAACFGPHVESVADCPACGERLEVAFDVADVVAPAAADPPAAEHPPVTLDWDGRTLHFRLPAAGDLLALAGCHDLDEGRRLLLQRCSLDADDEALAALPPPALEALAQRLAQADPQADVRLALACPACAHTWLAAFDIAAHLWAELDAWARRTLLEVHTLARAYGWREQEALALTPARRQRYLELIANGHGGRHGRS